MMEKQKSTVAIIGAVCVDDIAIPLGNIIPKASNPVLWDRRCGGVAGNVARATSKHLPTGLIAAVGDDATGLALAGALRSDTLELWFEHLPQTQTGRYTAVLDQHRNLFVGLSDVGQAEKLSWPHIEAFLNQKTLDAVAFDANLSENTIQTLCDNNKQLNPLAKLIAVAVSPAKAARLLPCSQHIDLLFCNRDEAAALTSVDINASLEALSTGLATQGFVRFVLSDAEHALICYDDSTLTQLNPLPVLSPENVNGAGDAMAGATLAQWVAGTSLSDALKHYGLPAAKAILTGDVKSPELVSSR